MSRKGALVQGLLYVVALVIGMAVGPFLFQTASLTLSPQAAWAANGAQNEPAAVLDTATCQIAEVAVYNNRIHVKCYTGFGTGGAIRFFAAPTSDAARVGRILSVLLSAEAAGKRAMIAYDPNANGTSFGCQFADCRPIDGVFILD